MIPHTPGPWRAGKVGDAVVADVPITEGASGTADVDYYGGYLVAESVAPCNRPLIAAAPKLLSSLRELVEAGESCVTSSDDVASMLRLGQATDAAKTAIAEAEGR